MTRWLAGLGLIMALVVSFGGSAGADIVDKPLPDPAAEDRARDLMKDVRCLVCQNQSIEDSDADLAKDLRLIVRERVAAGDSDAEIKAFLVDRYGDWVLLKPPVRGGTLFLWFSPLIFVLIGVVVLLHRRGRHSSDGLSPDEEARLAGLLGDSESTRHAEGAGK